MTAADGAQAPVGSARHRLSPKKLLLTKWTATRPVRKEKHFLVVRVLLPAEPGGPVQDVEIQAVHSGRTEVLPWRALTDPAAWRRGWV